MIDNDRTSKLVELVHANFTMVYGINQLDVGEAPMFATVFAERWRLWM